MTTKPIDLARISAPVRRIDEYLAWTLDDKDLPVTPSLREAMKYAVLNGGKRLRPLLCWYCCEALGGKGESTLAACAALEFVHAFSLVHDDLPALDNDDLRRGKPTLHKHASEAMAILAGDALLNSAYLHLCRYAPEGRAAALAQSLASATNQMIAGQVLDTLADSPATDAAERVKQVHEGKTGALIMAAASMAFECARGTEPVNSDHLASLLGFTAKIGLIFQIVDDLIDVEQSTEAAGKRTGKDADAGKLTYPAVHGVEASRAEVQRLKARALDDIAPLGPPAQPLRDLCEYLATRTS